MQVKAFNTDRRIGMECAMVIAYRPCLSMTEGGVWVDRLFRVRF